MQIVRAYANAAKKIVLMMDSIKFIDKVQKMDLIKGKLSKVLSKKSFQKINKIVALLFHEMKPKVIKIIKSQN